MKRKGITIILLLLGKLLLGQTPIDKNADLISNGLKIYFHPNDLLTNITIATKGSAGEKGIFFFFVGKDQIPPPSVRIDSLILKSYNNEFLTLHHPEYDSVFMNGRNINWQVMHSISLQESEFLRKNKIVSIILIVNKIPVQIFISKKSQGQLNKLAIYNW